MHILAEKITKWVDFFYSPFQRICSKQLFRYAVCGGGNVLLDWLLYFLIYNFVIGHQLVYLPPLAWHCFLPSLCLTPHIATLCIVFPITLLTGFWLNKHVTFTQSSLQTRSQLIRYLLIVALNLAINYFGLKLCVDIWSWYPTPSKMLITLLTVIISFFGQKYFSFR